MTKERNWTKTLLPLFIVALLGTWVFGATTGKIAGVVTDVETGDPLPGANVILEGTMMGAAADEEGRYFILNIPVGIYSIRAEVLGYKPHTITDVQVTIDHTTTVDFAMEVTVIAGEEVTVIAERPLIRMDNTATRTYITGEQITGMAAETVTELVELEAGAVGANVRGGRAEGTVYYIDGISMRNPMTGYGGQSGGTYRGPALYTSLSAELPEFAFSEVEMLTGGYSPEFGNAQDAVINIATKEGRSRHQGIVRVTTEGLFLSDLNGTEKIKWYIDPSLRLPPDYYVDDELVAKGGRLIMGGEEVDAQGIADIHKASELDNYGIDYKSSVPIWEEVRGDYDRKKISYSFSGPLFRNAYYAISGEYLDQGKGRYENQTRKNSNILGKFTYNLSARTKLNLTGMWSDQVYGVYGFSYAKYSGGYLPGYGPIYSPLEMLPDRFKTNLLLTGTLTQTLGPNAYINFTVGQFNSSYEQKREDYDDRDGDDDRDEYLVYKMVTVKSGHPDSTSGPEEYKEEEVWRYTTESEDLVYIWTRNPTKTDTSLATYDPAYTGEWKVGNEANLASGHLWSSPTGGGATGWREVWKSEYDPATEDWDWISEWRFVNGENEFEELGVAHPGLDEKILNVTDAYWIAQGDDFGYSKLESNVTTLKVDYANQATPIHFLQAGGELLLYKMDVLNLRGFSISNFYLDEWPQRKPYEWGLYFRDKIEMGGLIMNAGLRFDSYDLGSDVIYSGCATDPLKFPKDDAGDVREPKEWDNVKIYVSPRLGISHPITDRDVLHFSYNHFLQRPDWRYIYENLQYSTAGAYEEIGNPDLEPSRTVTYEVGFTHQFTENMKVDFTGYYKDIFGWVQQSKGGDLGATHIWYYENADFGNAKGFEISLDKRYSNYFSADVNYTYLIANGRLSDPQLGGTYLWRKLIQPRKVHPLDYDQRHTLNLNVNIYLPPSRNPFLLFGDWRLNITNRYGSGLPFDSQSRSVALVVPPENDKRRPFTNLLDIRAEKRLQIGPSTLTAWVEVFNLLDRINMEDDPLNAEWYLSEEDRDGNGVADHFEDPEGRRHDWTVWQPRRRVKVGIDISW